MLLPLLHRVLLRLLLLLLRHGPLLALLRGHWTLLPLLLRHRTLLNLLLRGRHIAHGGRGHGPDIAVGLDRLGEHSGGGMPMIHGYKLGAVGAGRVLHLDLRLHGRGVGLSPRSQFRRPGPNLNSS